MSLPLHDYQRYGRQMIIDGFGLPGMKIKSIIRRLFHNNNRRTAQAARRVRRGRWRWGPWLPRSAVPWRGGCWYVLYTREDICSLTEYVDNIFFLGRLGIIDHDRVELSNLQRQILHNKETVGIYKAESAALALRRCVIQPRFSNSTLTVCPG